MDGGGYGKSTDARIKNPNRIARFCHNARIKKAPENVGAFN